MIRFFLLSFFLIINFHCYSQWIQKGETINHNESSFGETLSLNADGTQVIIGNSNDSAVVYEFNGLFWIQKGSLLSDGIGLDRYGITVEINDTGNIIAVGAPLSEISGTGTGSLFIYNWDENDWVQFGSRIDGVADGDQIASRSIGMSSDGLTIAAGSGYATGNSSNSGHVRVFEWNIMSSDWIQKGNTLNGQFSNGLAGEFTSLSADGNTLAYSDLTNEGGFVFIYEWDQNTDSWTQKGDTILGETGEGWTGAEVKLSADGNTVAYGAPLYNNETGLVKVYDFNGTVWTQRGEAIIGEQEFSRFGREVDINSDGDSVFISGYAYDLEENSETFVNIGTASAYQWDGNTWLQKGDTFYGSENNSRLGQLGTVISGDGSTIGYVQRENGFDGAYVFEFSSNLSVQENNHNELISVFPNPVKNEVKIKLKSSNGGSWIIYNELGQDVMQGQLQGLDTKINTDDLVSGFYALQIKDQNNIIITVKRIIKS